jgi:hypothetical protein
MKKTGLIFGLVFVVMLVGNALNAQTVAEDKECFNLYKIDGTIAEKKYSSLFIGDKFDVVRVEVSDVEVWGSSVAMYYCTRNDETILMGMGASGVGWVANTKKTATVW